MNGEKMTVHLIDDDSETLFHLFEALSQAGFVPSASSTAVDGLAFVTRYRPRAVVCALEMAGIGGLEMLRQIRRVAPDCKVFLISAWRNSTLKEELIERGAEALLLKPYAEAELLGELDRVFHAAR